MRKQYVEGRAPGDESRSGKRLKRDVYGRKEFKRNKPHRLRGSGLIQAHYLIDNEQEKG